MVHFIDLLVRQTLIWLVLAMIFRAFLKPQRLLPNQPTIYEGWKIDIIYWFITPYISSLFAAIGVFFFFSHPLGELPFTATRMVDLPLWQQCLIMIVILDFFSYWTHRLLHTHRLWKFHAIHHMPKVLDWLMSLRFHPLDIFIHSTIGFYVVYNMGFSSEAYLPVIFIITIHNAIVHANLKWHFGSFKYLIVSPIFHREHHKKIYASSNGVNYGGVLSIYDVIFGTARFSNDVNNQCLGVNETICEHSYLKQCTWPFSVIIMGLVNFRGDFFSTS